MKEEFARFNLNDKEKAQMSTRELIRYLRAKKDFINKSYSNRFSATKGNKQYIEGHQNLITKILDTKTLNRLAKKVRTSEKISTSQQTWNQEQRKQKVN